jgi:16S rRNA (cytidine1402-2'-O)-methyltransferase
MARPRSAGQLIIAATPIGHLQDCSARLLDALGTADIIACEDTRHTGVLLAQHHITTHRVSYHEHNERARTPALVTRMLNGDTIALVTDAGTPAVSDPGYHLIRGAIDANIQVTWIPGPAACIGALVLSGLPVHAFTFVGFLPVKAGQRATALRALYDADRTVIAYEYS